MNNPQPKQQSEVGKFLSNFREAGYLNSVRKKRPRMMRLFRKMGARGDLNGWTEVDEAKYSGNKEVMESLGVSEIDEREKVKELKKLLINAIEREDLKSVEELLKKGVRVNFIDENDNTPMILACRKANVDIVLLLLEKKADVNLGLDGWNAFREITATQNGTPKSRRQIMHLLVENVRDLECAIRSAARIDNVEVVRYLRGCGISTIEALKVAGPNVKKYFSFTGLAEQGEKQYNENTYESLKKAENLFLQALEIDFESREREKVEELFMSIPEKIKELKEKDLVSKEVLENEKREYEEELHEKFQLCISSVRNKDATKEDISYHLRSYKQFISKHPYCFSYF